jgi:soluble lytic murein transglycosylase
MRFWSLRPALGASAAALAVALVLAQTGRIGELVRPDRIAGAPTPLEPKGPTADKSAEAETLASEIAALVRRGVGVDLGQTASLKPSDASSPDAASAPSRSLAEPAGEAATETLAQEIASLIRRGVDAIWSGGAESSSPPAGASDSSLPAVQPPPPSPAAVAYRKGDAAALAALARDESDPDRRLALEWAALRVDPHPALAALTAFSEAHPTWPSGSYLRSREEADLLVHPPHPAAISAFFATEPPQSSAGKLALAHAAGLSAHAGEAIRMARDLWRDGAFDAWTESALLRQFGGVLTKADHKYRADRLLYSENWAAAFRAAALAGPEETALAQVRYTAARGPLNPTAVRALPLSLKADPGLLFARVQDARRSNRAYEAATLLSLAPSDRDALINPDRWWEERRMVARELLDLNEPKLAFELCAKAVAPDEAAGRVDLEFHAGWIALRFLGDATEAARRFALAAIAAETPLSIARAEYWRGRAAEALGDKDEARVHFESAATEPIAYYGQLAAKRLGLTRLPLRAPTKIAEGDARDEAVRAAEALYAEGLDELATSLAFEAAKSWRDEPQMAAMAEVVKAHGDAATQVQFGKIATLRGYAFDAMAFPSSGMPAFLPLAHSADLPSVYAVARQESEFIWHAASGAGAKGLMQLLPSTAASTARRAGVPYDYERLLADPSFNTQLGAAFLGQVMEDVGGSRELAFAAYNAGPGRVAQWIAAYGDPRNGADPVDWVERIPFDETRDYVQRVSENLGVYQQRFAEDQPPTAQLSPRVAKD